MLRPNRDPEAQLRQLRSMTVLVPAAVAVVGAAMMALGCVPMAAWGLHVAALVPGILLALAVSRLSVGRLRRHGPAAAAVAVAAIGATFAGPAIDGVHRWIGLGPFTLHLSALVLPALVVGLAALAVDGRWRTFAGLTVAASALLALQPDAGQAAALALAGFAVIAVVLGRGRRTAILAAGLAFTLAATAATLAPDPLPVVAHVEGIVGLAAARGPAFRLLSLGFLATLPLPALIGTLHAVRRGDRFVLATTTGLFAYQAGAILAAVAGRFPVPVLGFGASHLLGFLLAGGLVAALVPPRPADVASAEMPVAPG